MSTIFELVKVNNSLLDSINEFNPDCTIEEAYRYTDSIYCINDDGFVENTCESLIYLHNNIFRDFDFIEKGVHRLTKNQYDMIYKHIVDIMSSYKLLDLADNKYLNDHINDIVYIYKAMRDTKIDFDNETLIYYSE